MSEKRRIVLILLLLGLLLASCGINLFTQTETEPTPVPPTLDPRENRVAVIPMPDPLELELLEQIPGLLAEARELMQMDRYAEAIAVWDQILEMMPDYAFGYSIRASIYNQMMYSETDSGLKWDYSAQAMEDILTAIEIGPEIGDYHALAYSYLVNFADLSEYEYLDRLPLWNEAIEHIPLAIDLVTRDESLNHTLGVALARAYRCREAFDYLDRIVSQQGTFASVDAGLEYAMGMTQACLGNYDEAIERMASAMQEQPSQMRYLVMAQIYFSAGRYGYAIDTLNNSFSTHGDYSGWRFYLRAAAHYEMGDTDLALADLERGMEQGVLRDHLNAYVLGRIALDEGDIDTGLAYLEDAQRTLSPADFPRLFEQIDELFGMYGYESDYQLPQVMLFANYPAYTDAQMALPEPPEGVYLPLYVNYQGTGYIFPYSEAYYDFGFTYVLTHRKSTDLAEIIEVDLVLQGYFLESGLQQGELGISIYLYNFVREEWDQLPDLAFGRVAIFEPEVYFSEEGFVYLNVVPLEDMPRVVLSNVGLEVLGEESDGDLVFIGFGQE